MTHPNAPGWHQGDEDRELLAYRQSGETVHLYACTGEPAHKTPEDTSLCGQTNGGLNAYDWPMGRPSQLLEPSRRCDRCVEIAENRIASERMAVRRLEETLYPHLNGSDVGQPDRYEITRPRGAIVDGPEAFGKRLAQHVSRGETCGWHIFHPEE